MDTYRGSKDICPTTNSLVPKMASVPLMFDRNGMSFLSKGELSRMRVKNTEHLYHFISYLYHFISFISHGKHPSHMQPMVLEYEKNNICPCPNNITQFCKYTIHSHHIGRILGHGTSWIPDFPPGLTVDVFHPPLDVGAA